jgi:hypothetical protein
VFKVRSVGIVSMSGYGIIIAASPVALPIGLVSAAGYLPGGSIISFLKRRLKEELSEPKKNKTNKYSRSLFSGLFVYSSQ